MGILRHLRVVGLAILLGAPGLAQAGMTVPQVTANWYKLILELVRHTATYTPPVASRAFGYIGVTGYEVVASGRPDMTSLAGQLNGFTAVPPRDAEAVYDEAVALQAAYAFAVQAYFSNTGPTGQRAVQAMIRKLTAEAAEGVPPEVAGRSAAYGVAVAQHVLDWSASDGGAVVTNMGFPLTYTPVADPSAWVPTSRVAQQQAPLLPDWGRNRPFAMPAGTSCPLPPPPAYSEDPASAFYAEAKEVYDVTTNLTPEQAKIARFWSDDPMLSSTPPGHWIAIALAVLAERQAGPAETVDVLARLGIGMADAFIGCWQVKYDYNLLRPITYIKRVIDPKWEPLINTPPFPEYPSGHSTQSAAAAEILTDLWGTDHAFIDPTHVDENMPAKPYRAFWEAAYEAGQSRLYGGIHFRSAISQGLQQGICIAAYTNALKTVSK